MIDGADPEARRRNGLLSPPILGRVSDQRLPGAFIDNENMPS